MGMRSVLQTQRASRLVKKLVRRRGVSGAVERLSAQRSATNDAAGWDDVARARRIAGRVAACRAAASPEVRAVAVWHLCRLAGIDAWIAVRDDQRLVVSVGQVVI